MARERRSRGQSDETLPPVEDAGGGPDEGSGSRPRGLWWRRRRESNASVREALSAPEYEPEWYWLRPRARTGRLPESRTYSGEELDALERALSFASRAASELSRLRDLRDRSREAGRAAWAGEKAKALELMGWTKRPGPRSTLDEHLWQDFLDLILLGGTVEVEDLRCHVYGEPPLRVEGCPLGAEEAIRVLAKRHGRSERRVQDRLLEARRRQAELLERERGRRERDPELSPEPVLEREEIVAALSEVPDPREP